MVLTAITRYPNAEFPGMVVGIDAANDVETYVNNAGTTAGVYDLVFTAVNDAVYTAEIYGVAVEFTADASATLAEIRDGMEAAIEAQPALVLRVTAVDSGNNLRITELDPELYGPSDIQGLDANTALSVVTAHSQLETVDYGLVVARGTNFQDLRLLRSSTAPIVGASMHQHMPVSAFKTADRAGYPPKSEVSVLKRGKIWMPSETAVALTDTLYARFEATAVGTVLGKIRNTNDGGAARDISASFKPKTARSDAGLVLVQVNLVP